METLIQTATRINQLKYDQEQGKLAPFEGIIVQVTASDDTMGVSFGPTRNRTMPVQHPFVGSTSWIRAMPNQGSRLLMQNRFDTGQPEALKTLPIGPEERTSAYKNQTNTYREMEPGEHDIASSGLALSFYGRRGNLDHRAGAGIKTQLDRDNLQIYQSAPTYKNALVYNNLGEMGDEQRLGIIKRWKSPIEEYYVQANDKFLSESYLQLKNPAGANPTVLLKRIEGHVYDDLGQVLKQTSTGLPLRSQTEWHTLNDQITKHEVDDHGNIYTELPAVATTGYELNIPKGSYNSTIGVDRNVLIQRDERVQVKGNVQYKVTGNVTYGVTKNVQVSAGSNNLNMDADAGSVSFLNSKSYGIKATSSEVTISGPSDSSAKMDAAGIVIKDGGQASLELMGKSQMATLKSPSIISLAGKQILIGNNAAISAVLGISLLTWLDTHTHTIIAPLPGIPTSPPVVPAASLIGTPGSIISTNIMLAPNI